MGIAFYPPSPYEIQPEPDKSCLMESGGTMTPLATLKSPTGGVSHIVMDDGCYCLVNGSADRPFRMVSHWYPEAVRALLMLAMPPGDTYIHNETEQ